MSFAEKSLYCIDCKKNFIFSIAEQEFHSSRGFPNVPSRCPSCHRAKANERLRDTNASEDYTPRRKTFPVTCTQCGKATQVPFQPRRNEPVYCSDCFVRTKVSR
jgi:CxxC-x17-CxxC domain-containing protein